VRQVADRPAVVVTGAASGIGRATAERIVRAGGCVGFVDRHADALAAVTAALPVDRVRSLPADVSDTQAIGAAVEAAATAFRGLTGLVTAAGIFHPGDMRPAAEVERDPDYVKRVVRGIPLGRIATPDEIAGVVCHLLGSDAAYVNGQVIAVDGGATVL
jgi:NAD(P)-dependent dehydrogenase (short-subunit alcohol dehydrogenase family)